MELLVTDGWFRRHNCLWLWSFCPGHRTTVRCTHTLPFRFLCTQMIVSEQYCRIMYFSTKSWSVKTRNSKLLDTFTGPPTKCCFKHMFFHHERQLLNPVSNCSQCCKFGKMCLVFLKVSCLGHMDDAVGAAPTRNTTVGEICSYLDFITDELAQ